MSRRPVTSQAGRVTLTSAYARAAVSLAGAGCSFDGLALVAPAPCDAAQFSLSEVDYSPWTCPRAAAVWNATLRALQATTASTPALAGFDAALLLRVNAAVPPVGDDMAGADAAADLGLALHSADVWLQDAQRAVGARTVAPTDADDDVVKYYPYNKLATALLLAVAGVPGTPQANTPPPAPHPAPAALAGSAVAAWAGGGAAAALVLAAAAVAAWKWKLAARCARPAPRRHNVAFSPPLLL